MSPQRIGVALSAVAAFSLTLCSCSRGTNTVAPTATSSPVAHYRVLRLSSLCSAIEVSTLAKFITGDGAAAMTTTPVSPAPGELASCQFEGYPGTSSNKSIHVSIGALVQSGENVFTKLAKENVKLEPSKAGTDEALYDREHNAIYVQFTNYDPAMIDGSSGVDSMLTLTILPLDDGGQSVYDSSDEFKLAALNLAMEIVQDINS